MSTILAYLPLAVLLAFAVLTALGAVSLLSRRQHPLRILSLALTNAAYLLIWALLIPLTSVIAIAWCVLVVATLAGIVVASVRASRPLSVPAADPAATRGQEKRRRRTLRQLSAPGLAGVIANGAVFVAVAVLALVAG